MNTTATQIITRAKKSKLPLVVGLCGGTASGKSTYSTILGEELQNAGYFVTIVNQDDFAIGRHFKNKHESPYKWDDPDNYRLIECYETVKALQSGQDASFVAYTLQAHEPVLPKTLKSDASNANYVILVEGLFAWYGIMADIVNYRIFLDANFYRRFILRLNRNLYESKHTDADTVIRQYFTHVARAQHDILDPLMLTADAVIKRDLPLPKAHNLKVFRLPDYIVYQDDELLIGVTYKQSRTLNVFVNGISVFEILINEESQKLLVQWRDFEY